MAKRPAQRQKTDAQRMPASAAGKVDKKAPRTAPVAATENRPKAEPERRERASGIDGIRERLTRDRDQAIARMRDLGLAPDRAENAPRAGAGSVLDEGDQAQASERQDMTFMTRERLADRINRLTTALQRLDSGAYGRCVMCGNAIEQERLTAMPEAETCLTCQEERERNARVA
ncbi:MAG: TraR/DksA C4-type zinc finger protein [Candidatus Rokubacteria bacterium]|nr:TraR/DksA C4-type zinc finger protein [Candidatus Rokubacteria bacterium]